MDDLFPDNTNAITSAMRCLRLNADLSRLPHIPTRHTYPAAARLPRIMHIPLANKVSFPTRHVRLEFDHSTVDYYIEIDTVLLSSQVSPETIAAPISSKRAEIVDKHRCETPSRPSLTDLPLDVLLLIGSLLDLRSLMHLSATCRYLRDPCLHFSQFHSVNLQPYWNRLTNASLENFFQHRCVQTRYLSLSWSRSIGILPFNALLTACSDHLVQLNLACCQYLTGEHIQIVANTCRNLQILNLESCTSLSNIDFEPLSNLDQIRSLNLYRTHIDYRTLLPLINRNASHFEHINLGEPSNVYTLAIDDGCTLSLSLIGSCQHLIDTVGIVKLLFARCSRLRSVDLWRAYTLTASAFSALMDEDYDAEEEEEQRIASLDIDEQEELALIYSTVSMPIATVSMTHLTCLSELDLGWTDPPPGFIAHVVKSAGRCLIKIFLTACRRK